MTVDRHTLFATCERVRIECLDCDWTHAITFDDTDDDISTILKALTSAHHEHNGTHQHATRVGS